MQTAVESFKVLGPLSIFATWIAGAFMLYTWRGDKSMTISQHASSHRHAYLVFALTLTIGGAVYYWFSLKWFIPTFHLSAAFTVLLTVALICQFITAWVPDAMGWKSTVHNVTAYGLSLLLLILVGVIVLSPEISTFARAVAAMGAALMSVIWILFVFVKSARAHYLFYQIVYTLSFHFVILATTYIQS